MSDLIGYFVIFFYFLLNLSAHYHKLNGWLNVNVTSLRSSITFAVLIPLDDTQTDRPLQ